MRVSGRGIRCPADLAPVEQQRPADTGLHDDVRRGVELGRLTVKLGYLPVGTWTHRHRSGAVQAGDVHAQTVIRLRVGE
jgi:hypothetical protein